MRSGNMAASVLGVISPNISTTSREAEGGNGDADVPEQPDADNGGDGGGQDVDQVVADEDEAKQAVWSGQQLFDPTGRLVLGLGQMPQLVAVSRV